MLRSVMMQVCELLVTIDNDVLAVARALADRNGSQPRQGLVGAGEARIQERGPCRRRRQRRDRVCGRRRRRAHHQRRRLPVTDRVAVTALLDVNVLIALAWPNHVHHAAARAWFEDRRDGTVGQPAP